MNNEKLLAKLEKLLALAGSSNEHEASLAMEKAIQIAVANNVDLSRVARNAYQEIVKESLGLNANRLSVTHKFVTDIIHSYFEVKVITAGNRKWGRQIYFIGHKDKIDFAKFLHTYLTNTFFNLWYAFYKKNPNVTVSTARESYFYGLYSGLCKKLDDAKAEAEKAIDKDAQGNYSLMVVTSAKELQQAVYKFFPECTTAKSKEVTLKSQDAVNSGFSDGQKINVYAGLTGNKQEVLV